MLLKAGAGGDDPSGGAGGGSGAKKSVDLVDASQGRNQEVVSLALDQHSGTRHVAYIDKNNDVYLKASPLLIMSQTITSSTITSSTITSSTITSSAITSWKH